MIGRQPRKTPAGFAFTLLVTLLALPEGTCPRAAPSATPNEEVTRLAAVSDSIVRARVVSAGHTEAIKKGEPAVTECPLEVIETLRGAPLKTVSLVIDGTGAEPGGGETPAPPLCAKGAEVVVFLMRTAGGGFAIAGGPGRGLSVVKREASGAVTLQGGAADGLALPGLAALGKGHAADTMGEPPGAPGSGIEGEVWIGPIKPSQRIGDPPNVAPYATTLVIEAASSGKEVARVESGQDGRFRIALPAGDYVLKPAASGRFQPRAEPLEVKVLPGRIAKVSVNFDSGMR